MSLGPRGCGMVLSHQLCLQFGCAFVSCVMGTCVVVAMRHGDTRVRTAIAKPVIGD